MVKLQGKITNETIFMLVDLNINPYVEAYNHANSIYIA